MTFQYKVICGCEFCIAAKILYSALFTYTELTCQPMSKNINTWCKTGNVMPACDEVGNNFTLQSIVLVYLIRIQAENYSLSKEHWMEFNEHANTSVVGKH